MFDVPIEKKQRLHWQGELPIDDDDWNVGLIVGPSGAGKSVLARHLYAKELKRGEAIKWSAQSVIDDFAEAVSIEEISGVCQSVGFNTIPAWLRPYAVLSNGEKFRVDIARRLLELKGTIVVDEFTSVVDRQVAKITSHAVQKYIRAHKRKFVAVTCHHDIEDWLQPDWIVEMPEVAFRRRLLRQRPPIELEIRRVSYSLWSKFAPYHYLTSNLRGIAACYAAFIEGQPASFVAVLPMALRRKSFRGVIVSRLVTLPDYQGIGIAMALMKQVASAYISLPTRFFFPPAHPALIRGFSRSPDYVLVKRPGAHGVYRMPTTRCKIANVREIRRARPCAVFEYRGKPMDRKEAIDFLGKSCCVTL